MHFLIMLKFDVVLMICMCCKSKLHFQYVIFACDPNVIAKIMSVFKHVSLKTLPFLLLVGPADSLIPLADLMLLCRASRDAETNGAQIIAPHVTCRKKIVS